MEKICFSNGVSYEKTIHNLGEIYKCIELNNGDILLQKIILDNTNYKIIDKDNGDKDNGDENSNMIMIEVYP